MGLFSWVSDAVDSVVDTASSIGRGVAVFGQGVVQGVASGVGGLVDLGAMASNAVIGTEFATNTADTFREGVTMDALRPRNDFERGLQAVGRGVGEVASYAAVGVVTFGAGGAVAGALSGTARAGAVRAVAHVAPRVLPYTRTGQVVDAASVAVLSGIEMHQEFSAHDLANEVRESGLESERDRAATMAERDRAFVEEYTQNQERLDSGDLTADERSELEGRQEEIREGARIILQLKEGELEPDERQRLEERLEEIQPTSALDPNDGVVSPLLLSRDTEGRAVNDFTTTVADAGVPETGAMVWSDPALQATFGTNIDPELASEKGTTPTVRQIELA